MNKEELTQSVKEHGRLTQFNEELDKLKNNKLLANMSQSEIEEIYFEAYRKVMNT